jgi:hexokinase
MGGTNLRVCEITLTEEKGEFDIIQSKYRMPEELKTGTAEELWEYIADCLQQFIEYHHDDFEGDLAAMPLGFTFSYPATQDYIDHGVLQRWTKGFDISGVEGEDVVPQFQAALDARVSHALPVQGRGGMLANYGRNSQSNWLPSSTTPPAHSSRPLIPINP